MRYLTLIGVAALLAGCGEGANREATPTAPPASPPGSQPGPPTTPKPTLSGVSDGPPTAWLETEGGSFWLGYSSYCWGTVCADFIAPSCDAKHTPRIALRRGELVTAHLDFEPTELGLSYLSGMHPPSAQDQTKLDRSKTPSWRAERGGPFSLFAHAKGGDASYVACVELR